MENLKLAAEKRTEFKKNNTNRLRAAGMLPGVIYSHGETENIKFNAKAFSNLFKGRISESVIFEIDLKDDEAQDVYVKEYQTDPVTDEIKHVDFFKVTKGEKIHTTIKIETEGNPVGVKKGGVFEILEREIAVEVLPKDLKECIFIDVSDLDVNDAIHVKDIKKPESMDFLLDPEQVIAHVVTPKQEEEPAEDEEMPNPLAEPVQEEGTEE